jgi:hypothetical protein
MLMRILRPDMIIAVSTQNQRKYALSVSLAERQSTGNSLLPLTQLPKKHACARPGRVSSASHAHRLNAGLADLL